MSKVNILDNLLEFQLQINMSEWMSFYWFCKSVSTKTWKFLNICLCSLRVLTKMDNIYLYLLLPLLVNTMRLFVVTEVSKTHNEMLGFSMSPNPDNLGIWKTIAR